VLNKDVRRKPRLDTKLNHVLARNVARQNVVDANEVKIAAEREGDKISVKQYNGDAGHFLSYANGRAYRGRLERSSKCTKVASEPI
jgi:hypothetical protein